MNLDFGILWIEDSFSNEEEEALKRRVKECGFIAKIATTPNGNDLAELSRTHVLFHKFDLILLDFKLKDVSGDDLAPTIRRLFPSTNILFYSGSVDEEELRKKIAEKQVEGVYCSHRSRFIQRTGNLIDQTAMALNRLSGMRGLAMRVVAECDELMKSAILHLSATNKTCSDKTTELDESVISSLTECIELYNVAADGSIEDRFRTRSVDSSKIFGHFRRLTKEVTKTPADFNVNQEMVERLKELRNQSAKYTNNVLSTRNTLGHAIEIEGPNGWSLKGSDEITIQDFAAIRQSFADHIDAFREMVRIVGVP
ncbi:response regulator [Brucella rhizosphaerae]|uniref:response regulator n=1 Tax=Brucella rhizosphaerae TaxID=571254 RepID=UPI000B983E00|nr:response regulator [Brucella rhizosphaerae]